MSIIFERVGESPRPPRLSRGWLSPYSQDTTSEGSPLPRDYHWIDRGRTHTPAINRVWQKDFYDFNIFTKKKFIEKLDYIYNNPVKAGLVKNPEEWPASPSFQKVNNSNPPSLVISYLITQYCESRREILLV